MKVNPADEVVGERPGRKTRKGWLSYAVRFLVSASVLTLLIRSVSWADMAAALASADRTLLAIGCLFAVPIVGLKGIKWWLLLRHAGIAVPLRKTSLSYVAGLGFGLVTPGRVGELARIWVLGLGRHDYLRAGTLVLVDRLTDLAALLCVLSASVFYFFGVWWLAAYVLVGIAGCSLWLLLTSRWRGGQPGRSGKVGPLARIVSAAAGIRAVHLGIYVCFGFVVTLCGVCMVYLFLSAMQSVAFLDCLCAIPPVFMNSLLPVSIGGVGVRELIMTAVCDQIGVPSAVAISAILVYFTGSMLLPGAAGLVLFALFRPRPP